MRLQEFSTTDPGIQDYLEQRGYRLLGKGVDQMAFAEPDTGLILKVFGTQCTGSEANPRLSQDQQMFRLYAGFCERNRGNPFLPRIHGYETFVYPTQWGKRTQRCLYLQIRTEPLQHYTGIERDVLNDMSNAVRDNVTWDQYYSDMEYQTDDDAQEWYAPAWNRMTNSPEKIKMWGEFYRTMRTLYEIGSRQGYAWDLHGDNVMRRSDGTPVIVDPWVIH